MKKWKPLTENLFKMAFIEGLKYFNEGITDPDDIEDIWKDSDTYKNMIVLQDIEGCDEDN